MFAIITLGLGIYVGCLIERQEGDTFPAKVKSFIEGLHF